MTVNQKTSSPKKPRLTLQQVRNRPSPLRPSTLDVDAWMILQQWMRPIALSAWIVAFVLALAVGYLVLWRTPKPVPFVQEEHGMVLWLPTLPMQGENHGH